MLAGLAALLAGCSSDSTTSAESVATTVAAPTTTVPPTTIPPLPAEGLGPGATGEQVRFVESRLDALRFDVGSVDDVFDDNTIYAVQAFQKLVGLERNGIVTQPVLERLSAAQPPPPLVAGGGANRVEIDLPRQLLFLYESDALSRILPVSSGTGEEFCSKGSCGVAVTPVGAFRVDYWKPGWDDSPLGELYNPVYFNPKDGIAIHGYQEVPTEPASHGCVRIPMAAAEWFPNRVSKGTPVYVIDGQTPVAPLSPDDPGAAGA